MLWDDLKAQVNAPGAKHRAKTVAVMHRRHGLTEGRACGDCRHFYRYRADMQIEPFKCRLFKQERDEEIGYVSPGGAATDWRRKWPACGKFEPSE